jgi:ubiquitin-like protein ATG12
MSEPEPSEPILKQMAQEKVKVHFVAVGSAPIMKKNKFQIGADQRFSAVTAFLQKMLKLQTTAAGSSSLFLYCQSAFVPGPEEIVGDLRDCFAVRDELFIHYSLQEAWG